MPFKIPLQSEVAAYIKTKKPDWPDDFITYYADRFWNHYQASGWRLANKNLMKDWQAAFNANWQTLKFKEDTDKLNACQALVVKATVSDATNGSGGSRARDYVNQMLVAHANGDKVTKKDILVGVYDWLKRNNLMKLPREIIDEIMLEAGNDRDYAKCAAVHKWLDLRIQQGRLSI